MKTEQEIRDAFKTVVEGAANAQADGDTDACKMFSSQFAALGWVLDDPAGLANAFHVMLTGAKFLNHKAKADKAPQN